MRKIKLYIFYCMFIMFESLICIKAQNSSLLIRKCCPESQKMDWNEQKCVDHGSNKTDSKLRRVSEVRGEDYEDFPWWMNGEVKPLSPNTYLAMSSFLKDQEVTKYIEFGFETCYKPYALYVYSGDPSYNILHNGSLVYHTEEGRNITFPPTSYCADMVDSYYVYVPCPCAERTCIDKCCPRDDILHIKSDTWQCVPKVGNTTWNPQLHDDNVREEYIRNQKLPISCSSPQISMKDITNINDWLLSDSSVLADYGVDYCGEKAVVDDNVTAVSGVLVCTKDDIYGLTNHTRLLHVMKSLTIALLVLTLVVIAAVPETRNTKSNIIICHIGSLLTGRVIELIDSLISTRNDLRCYILVFTSRFFHFAPAFWINVLCFDIACTFRVMRALQEDALRRNRRRFILYSLYAWGTPVIMSTFMGLVAIFGVFDGWITTEIYSLSCFDMSYGAAWVYDFGPLLVLSSANTFLLVYTIIKIAKAHCCDTAMLNVGNNSRHDRSSCLKGNARWIIYVNLLCLMGPPRVVVIASWAIYRNDLGIDGLSVQILSNCTKLLEAMGIFLFICCKPRVIRLLLFRLRTFGRFISSPLHKMRGKESRENLEISPRGDWSSTITSMGSSTSISMGSSTNVSMEISNNTQNTLMRSPSSDNSK